MPGEDPPAPPEHVVPFVSPYWLNAANDPSDSADSTYQGWFPPQEDFNAMIQHIKLRGAEGYVFWQRDWFDRAIVPVNGQDHYYLASYLESDWADPNADWINPPNGDTPGQWFERHAALSWDEIDLASMQSPVPYRYETNKTSGVVVSAVNDRGRLHMLVSYMKQLAPGQYDLINVGSYFCGAATYTGGIASPSFVPTSYLHTFTDEYFVPDIDGNHIVNMDDQSLWIAMFTAGDPAADWDLNGVLDLDDLGYFLAAYQNCEQ